MLKKIVAEEFSKTITENKEILRDVSYTNVITSRLEGYIRQTVWMGGPGSSFVYEGVIPCIPGGFLRITEVNRGSSSPHIEKVKVKFEYLEGALEEDLRVVRDAITTSGLEPIVK